MQDDVHVEPLPRSASFCPSASFCRTSILPVILAACVACLLVGDRQTVSLLHTTLVLRMQGMHTSCIRALYRAGLSPSAYLGLSQGLTCSAV